MKTIHVNQNTKTKIFSHSVL